MEHKFENLFMRKIVFIFSLIITLCSAEEIDDLIDTICLIDKKIEDYADSEIYIQYKKSLFQQIDPIIKTGNIEKFLSSTKLAALKHSNVCKSVIAIFTLSKQTFYRYENVHYAIELLLSKTHLLRNKDVFYDFVAALDFATSIELFFLELKKAQNMKIAKGYYIPSEKSPVKFGDDDYLFDIFGNIWKDDKIIFSELGLRFFGWMSLDIYKNGEIDKATFYRELSSQSVKVYEYFSNSFVWCNYINFRGSIWNENKNFLILSIKAKFLM